MAQIGIDCELIIDNQPYFVLPKTFRMRQPRIRKATTRADGAESYVDLGPGKRVWSMIILCRNDLVKYDGQPTGLSGQQYRDALRSSYTGSIGSTINFTDPLNGAAIAVHFDSYAEAVDDLHVQQVALAAGTSPALSYLVAIELIES